MNEWLGGRDSNPDRQIQSPIEPFPLSKINNLARQIAEKSVKIRNACARKKRRVSGGTNVALRSILRKHGVANAFDGSVWVREATSSTPL